MCIQGLVSKPCHVAQWRLGNQTMQTATQSAQAAQHFTGQFLPLEQVTRPNLKTEEAAHYLNRRPQTLRAWACLENGPIRPRRVGGLLAWSTAEIKALAGVTA
jgi:hypothetical protein